MRSKVFVVISLLCVSVVVADHWQTGVLVDQLNQANAANNQQLARIINVDSSLDYALKAEEIAFSAVKQLEEAKDELKKCKSVILEYRSSMRRYDKAMNDAGLNTQALINENAKLNKTLDMAEEVLNKLERENAELRKQVEKLGNQPSSS